MKKTLLLLTVVGGLVLPAVTQADPLVSKHKKTAPSRVEIAHGVTPSQQKMIFYITGAPRTGSNIPMVYRRYNDRLDSASNAAVYGQSSLQSTGSLDVATELFRLDPSIGFRHN